MAVTHTRCWSELEGVGVGEGDGHQGGGGLGSCFAGRSNRT